MNNKGMSAVVTTLLILLLVIVAVGVLWIVVSGIVERGSSQINFKTKCLETSFEITSVDCNDPAACQVSLTRKTGNDEITGIKLVFSNSTDSNTVPIEVLGNVVALGSKTVTDVDSGLIAPNNVKLTAYFTDDGGEEVLCDKSAERVI